jgi:hypothetical protein
MIIVGDIACPNRPHSFLLNKVFKNHFSIFRSQSLICNLEGLISDNIGSDNKTPILYNHSSVLNVLQAANCIGVGLANNHTLDLPDCFEDTKQKLHAVNIPFNGAGNSVSEAEAPVALMDRFSGKKVIQFNFCWDFLLYHQNNPSNNVFVAEIDEIKLLKNVKHYRDNQPEASILVFLHWSFDLETLPFPMYRQFAKALIDAGADCVIGAHSHCVQGGEKYKEGYIVYGLGNFYLPNNVYASGNLKFPEMSKLELAFEYDLVKKTARCHWFEYENSGANHQLNFIKTEKFEESKILLQYSPFTNLSHSDYITLLVPVYKNYNAVFQNKIFTGFLKGRAGILRTLAKYKIRKWQN